MLRRFSEPCDYPTTKYKNILSAETPPTLIEQYLTVQTYILLGCPDPEQWGSYATWEPVGRVRGKV